MGFLKRWPFQPHPLHSIHQQASHNKHLEFKWSSPGGYPHLVPKLPRPTQALTLCLTAPLLKSQKEARRSLKIYASLGLWFHSPRCQFGIHFLSHSHFEHRSISRSMSIWAPGGKSGGGARGACTDWLCWPRTNLEALFQAPCFLGAAGLEPTM